MASKETKTEVDEKEDAFEREAAAAAAAAAACPFFATGFGGRAHGFFSSPPYLSLRWTPSGGGPAGLLRYLFC
ncbi:unnamed protein product [Victoria cruziana]